MSDNIELLNESASIVLVGYPLNIHDFKQLFINSKAYKNFDFSEKLPEIEFDGEINQEQLNKILAQIPVSVYESKKYGFNIVLLQNENKLSFSIKEFKTNKLESINQIIDILFGCDISKISEIGFNYVSRYKFSKNEKLKLLNPEIENIKINENKIWENNKTFILTIPFQFDDHISTYKIQKMIPVKEIKDAKRIYQIEANQNFNLRKENNMAKNSEAINIINKLENLYCNEFLPMCNEILRMYYK